MASNMGQSYVIPAVQNLPTTVIVKEKNPISYDEEKEHDDKYKDELELWKKKYFTLEA